MEDIQLIIYIIFAVLYLVFKVMQKKKEPGHEESGPLPQNQERKRQPQMTFEEMLREFTGENATPEVRKEEKAEQPKPPLKRKEKPVSAPVEQTEYFSYEKEYEREQERKSRQVYYESIKHGQKAQTLDEQVDLEKIGIGKVELAEDPEEKKNTAANEILDAFKTQEGARKAFIYGEIFHRKYT